MSTVTGKGEEQRIYLFRHADVSYFREDGTLVQQLWLPRFTN